MCRIGPQKLEKLQLSEKIPAEKLNDSQDTRNVDRIYGMFSSEQGNVLFADYSNRSVKELQLQTRIVKTLYRTDTDWRVLNVLLHSDSQTLLFCEADNIKYVLFCFLLLFTPFLISHFHERHMKKMASFQIPFQHRKQISYSNVSI